MIFLSIPGVGERYFILSAVPHYWMEEEMDHYIFLPHPQITQRHKITQHNN
jgi:hypothetical protein